MVAAPATLGSASTAKATAIVVFSDFMVTSVCVSKRKVARGGRPEVGGNPPRAGRSSARRMSMYDRRVPKLLVAALCVAAALSAGLAHGALPDGNLVVNAGA